MLKHKLFVVGYLTEFDHIFFVRVVSFPDGDIGVECLTFIHDVGDDTEVGQLPCCFVHEIAHLVEPNVVVRDQKA